MFQQGIFRSNAGFSDRTVVFLFDRGFFPSNGSKKQEKSELEEKSLTRVIYVAFCSNRGSLGRTTVFPILLAFLRSIRGFFLLTGLKSKKKVNLKKKV